MEAKSNIRRLLAGSSLVALLAASGPALGASTTISGPTGPVTVSNTIDFIQVTAGGYISGDLTISSPNGAVDLLANGSSFVGVDINQGAVDGGIINNNDIGVLAASTGLPIGIAVHGTGASVGGGIHNNSHIAVTGVNSALGIAVYGPSGVTLNGGIVNDPAAGVGIKVKARQERVSGTAVAGGILVDVSEGFFGGTVQNLGAIRVNATEISGKTDGVISATSNANASGYAHAIASGMGVGLQTSYAGMSGLLAPATFTGSLVNQGGLIRAEAQANSTHTALAVGSGEFIGIADATAKGTDTAEAYGMFVTAGIVSADVANTGNVVVKAAATSVNNATAHGVGGIFTAVADATALASGKASAYASGMLASANTMIGQLTNQGNVGLDVKAHTTNIATADSSDTANAKAQAVGNADAKAYGMNSQVNTLDGAVVNTSSGVIDAYATAEAKNTANVIGTSGAYLGASALATSSVSATAGAMNVEGISLHGAVANAGTINASAVGIARNTATVQVQGPATAKVESDGYSAKAQAAGIYVSEDILVSATSTGISQGGTINSIAQAQVDQNAKATGISLANAVSHGNILANGVGMSIDVGTLYGNVVNDGHITVTALATLSGSAAARATGVSAGLGKAEGANFAVARAQGILSDGQTFVGDFINATSGVLDVKATANVFGTAKATGTALNNAEATLYNGAYAYAGGIALGNGTSFVGDISNYGHITVGALASTSNYATASAQAGNATAVAIDAPHTGSYGHAFGVVAGVNTLTGNFLNDGDVDVGVVVNELDSAKATGALYANAYAGGHGFAAATGVSVGVGAIANGFVSNAGTITVHSIVQLDSHATADATVGQGNASVAGQAVAGALGFAVDGAYVNGDVVNSGDITDIALASAYNGKVLAGLTGVSMAGSMLGPIGLSSGISLGATALGGAIATGISNAGAHVVGNVQANGTGFRSSVDYVGGDVVNSGHISSVALALTTNEAYAHVESYGTAYAAARGLGARAVDRGMQVSGVSINGMVVNTNTINSVAIGASLNKADAVGTSLAASKATANAYGSAFGTAIGLGVNVGTLTGGFLNYGSVTAVGGAVVFNSANALAGPGGTANARAEDLNVAQARATGISVSAGAIGSSSYLGGFENDGSVNAWALTLSDNSASAKATGSSLAHVANAHATGSANAQANGIYLHVDTVAGTAANSGTVSVLAGAFIHDDAYANGQSAQATAVNHQARANSVGFGFSGLAHSGFENTGNIYATAYAGSLPGAGTSFAGFSTPSYGVGNHAEAFGGTNANASAGGTASANAIGIEFTSSGTVGSGLGSDPFLNNGNIHARAIANLSDVAYAHSLGNAQATAGVDHEGAVVAHATGISIDAAGIAGNLRNGIAGDMYVTALAADVNFAKATGASNGHATAAAYGSASATAYGLNVGDNSSPSILGDLINAGDLNVYATAFVANVATAEAGAASAYAGMTSEGSNAYDVAQASAMGINAHVGSLSGGFVNSGKLDVAAHATSIDHAQANGVSLAYASARGSANASAQGIYLSDQANNIASVSNSGSITLTAQANADVKAVATATAGQAKAYEDSVSHVRASATGLIVDTGVVGDVYNGTGGSMSIHAIATGNLFVKAKGEASATANASGASSTAKAYGIFDNSDPIGGNFINHGALTVGALATNTVNVLASSTGVSAGGVVSAAINDHEGSAQATASGIYLGVNSIGGSFTNTGNLTVDATGKYVANVTATGYGLGNAKVETGDIYSYGRARGIYLDGVTVGGVSNSGSVTVNAKATADVKAVAVSHTGKADAYAWTSLHANATGISISGNVLGDFVNYEGGVVAVGATAIGQVTAKATGHSGAFASSYSYESVAEAYGISVDGTIGGDFINQATITANAKASEGLTVQAKSTGVSGAITAAIYDDEGYAQATATGIYLYLPSFGGSFNNSGSINVKGTANFDATVSAIGVGTGDALASSTSDGSANAHAHGIYLNNFGSPLSSVSNTGAITLNASADFKITAKADSDASAKAYATSGSAYAYATGLTIYSDVIGNVYNGGTGVSMNIHATAKDTSTLHATAKTSASAEVYSPDVSAEAYGINVGGGNYIGGDFTNDGALTVGAAASAHMVVTASVTGVSVSGASAEVYDNEGGASAQATGIYVDASSIGGNFVNHGQLDVNATAHFAATVSALGAAGNGENAAYAWASASATAVGINLYSNSLDGNIINTGAITVTAKADTQSKAKATTGTGGDANAYAAYDDGYNEASAQATGIDASFDTFGGTFTNSGAVVVKGTATALATSTATGPSSSGTADGYANAAAIGITLNATNMTASGGQILNSSLIDVAAKALASATLVLGALGSGLAYANANGQAQGLKIRSNGEIANSIVNSDTITVVAKGTAKATSDAGASAQASAQAIGLDARGSALTGGFENSTGSTISAKATASAYADGVDFSRANAVAKATGVSLYGTNLISGGVTNDGTIVADAQATAHSTGGTNGSARASALGLDINAYSFMGQIYNSGDITASAHSSAPGAGYIHAQATGVLVDLNGGAGTGLTYGFVNDTGDIKATATGHNAYAHAVDVVNGSFAGVFYNTGSYATNEGTFEHISHGLITASANATGGGNAQAVAIEVNHASFMGGLFNSGNIEAIAHAPGGTAVATAILVNEGGNLGGDTIDNTGIIRATATGTSVTTNAINLDGAGGPTTINQIGQKDESGNVFGGIYGDIRTNNGWGDTINWTGGEIVGDIHGESLDTMNVYVGSPSLQGAFVFNGNINAGVSDSSGNFVADSNRFGVLNIATGGSTAPAVSLEVSGNMYLGALNVFHNATLVVDPTAQIDATNVTIAGTSLGNAATVQWNIQPVYPQAGSIKGNVTIDTGAKSVAYGMPGLFAATNDFWVIKDADGVTGEFAAGTNPTTTDATTVTPLGNFLNGLYTVTDGYVTSGPKQGYHIYVTRMSFADIPGLTEDGTNYGKYVDTILDYLNKNAANGPLATLLGQILTGTPEEYAHALNEMSGHQNGDLLLAALGDPTKLLQIVFSELSGGDLGGGGGVASLDTFVQVADNGNISATTMSDAGPQYAALGAPTSVVERPARAWVRVFGNWSSLDRDASVGSNGYTANGGGVVVGGDYRFSDTFKAGIAAGYQKNKIDFRGAGNADTDSYSLSAYGRYTQGPLYVNGLVGFSLQQYDMTRYYTPLATTYAAYRSPNGSTYSTGVEAGYGFDLGDKAKVTPFAGLMYSHTKIDGGTETGTGPGNLTINDQSANSFASRLGVRWSKVFETDGGSSWTPIVELGWRHEFSDTNPTTTASLAGLPGSYTINGSDVPADAALVGLGLKLQLSDSIDGTVQYNGDFTSKSTNSTASVKIQMKF